ncbi:MAG: hypothetical protein SFU83_11780 [Meiothermus sp.]|nr:hypothetical protein [Meiothermus sp.]
MELLYSEEDEAWKAIIQKTFPLEQILLETTEFLGSVLDELASNTTHQEDLRRVHVHLLCRLLDDLRVIHLSASIGYQAQAMSLLASVYELIATMQDVGVSPEKARGWLEHKDDANTFTKSKAARKLWFEFLGVPDAKKAAEDEYKSTYRMLCMFKHYNPQIQQGLSLEPSDKGLTFSSGPQANNANIGLSCLAIAQACAFAIEGLACLVRLFSTHSVEVQTVMTLHRKFKGFEAELLDLGR